MLPISVDITIITSENINELTEMSVALCSDGIISLSIISVRTSIKSSKNEPANPPNTITYGSSVNIIANAHKTIDLEREKTVQDLQTQIAGLAMMAAGKVLGKADAAEQNKLMYEQFLAKTGGCNDTDSK